MEKVVYYPDGSRFMTITTDGAYTVTTIFSNDGFLRDLNFHGPAESTYNRFFKNGAKIVWSANHEPEFDRVRRRYDASGQLVNICSYNILMTKKHGDERYWVDGKEYLKRWKNGRLVG